MPSALQRRKILRFLRLEWGFPVLTDPCAKTCDRGSRVLGHEPALLAALQRRLRMCLLCSNRGGTGGTFSLKWALRGITSCLSTVTDCKLQNRQ